MPSLFGCGYAFDFFVGKQMMTCEPYNGGGGVETRPGAYIIVISHTRCCRHARLLCYARGVRGSVVSDK